MSKGEWLALPLWTRKIRKKAVGLLDELNPDIAELKRQFAALDVDNSGLDEEEVAAYIESLTDAYVDHDVFASVERNAQGKIEFAAFSSLVRPLVDSSVLQLRRVFDSMDKDSDGLLDYREVEDYYRAVCHSRAPKGLFHFQKNRPGKIDHTEFIRVFKPKVDDGMTFVFPRFT